MLRIGLVALILSVAVGVTMPLTPAVQAADGQPVQLAKTDPGGGGAAQDTKGENVDPVSGKQVKNTSVVEYINEGYKYLAGVGGLLAIIMLIYAGYRYMTSYGDPEALSDAKDIIEKALIGLVLLILAAVILQTINPRTVNPCTPGQPGCGDVDFTKPKG